MKKINISFKIVLSLILLAFILSVIPLNFVFAGKAALTEFEDYFSDDTINPQYWNVEGDGVIASETKGALTMKTINGYSHSIVFQAFNFIGDKDYTIEFDASIKSEGETWLGVVIGATGVGSTYEKRSSNGILFSAGQTGVRIDNYLSGVLQQSERFTNSALDNKGGVSNIKIEIVNNNGCKANIYIKRAEDAVFADMAGQISIGTVEGILGFQSNGSNAIVKISDLKIYEAGSNKLVESEDFSKPTEELICSTDDRDGYRFVAQNLEYYSGIGKIAKFNDVENAALITKTTIKKYKGNIENFKLKLNFEIIDIVNSKFGIVTGLTENYDGDFLYITKSLSGYNLMFKKNGKDAVNIAALSNVSGQTGLEVIGTYNNTLKVLINEQNIAVIEDVEIEGKLAIAVRANAEDTKATVNLFNCSLISYSYKYLTNMPIASNFNAMKNGSTIDGYINNKQWRTVGNVTVRNGVLRFLSGDIYTSFNTVEKYDDFILRFDVTRISGSYTRDTDDLYSTVGTYADMSIGVSVGKQTFNESSNSGEHASIQFTTRYWNQNAEGKFIPNMIIWAYGTTLANGESAKWPSECWWHDGSDGKVVTGEDGLKINVMIVAKNRNIYVYYKYSNQDESYFDNAKAVFVNVKTYGHVAISCGYNSTFDIDNLSITPLSFENYM